jgi:hypothetical protein
MMTSDTNDPKDYVLPDNEVAIVTADNMTELHLMLPSDDKLGDTVPELVLFMTAVFMRVHKDDEFFTEQLKWLCDQQQSREDGKDMVI